MKKSSNEISAREIKVLQVLSDGHSYGNKKLIPIIKAAALKGIIS